MKSYAVKHGLLFSYAISASVASMSCGQEEELAFPPETEAVEE
jgi:hypothetical protein